MAVRQGFEPWKPFGLHAFQACAFDHSATSPQPSEYTTFKLFFQFENRPLLSGRGGLAGSCCTTRIPWQ